VVRRPRVAALGGTFDRLHAGHRYLLATAFAEADRVAVGVTTDAYLAVHPKAHGGAIAPYRLRRRRLHDYLLAEYPRRTWTIGPLADGYGRSVEPGIDVLVVSDETREGARRVNVERRRRDLPPLQLVIVPQLLADDLRPLSASRIRAGEVTRTGRATHPVWVEIDPQLSREIADDLQTALRRAWPRGGRWLRVYRPSRPRRSAVHPRRGRRPAFALRPVRRRGAAGPVGRLQLEDDRGPVGPPFPLAPARALAQGLGHALADRRAVWVDSVRWPRRRRSA